MAQGVATDDNALPGGTGIVAVTGGVGRVASPGVDYAKGPWKLFSTVRLAAAAQTLSIPVVDGENNGIIRATGRLISDGTDRVVTIKVNGSATNVALETLAGAGATASAAAGSVPSSRKSVYQFQLIMFTSSRSGTVKRAGIWHSLASDPAGPTVTSGASGLAYNDSTTVITSIDIDCGAAAGLAIGTEVIVEEGIVS